MRLFLLAILTISLSACATFTPDELANLDYGAYPENYKQIISSYFARNLKDPSSAIVEYRGGPTKIWQQGSIISAKAYGWGVCLSVNAKNSFGGYVGNRPYAFLIRNGSILHVHGEMETNMFDSALADTMCKKLGSM